ncbi:MAG: hypothetical protein IPN18_15895 [Ignavibacteriales bacterium]|nr:hypothetical protein [Ignavibacteriales bacterium]
MYSSNLNSLPPVGDEIVTPHYSKEENDVWGIYTIAKRVFLKDEYAMNI